MENYLLLMSLLLIKGLHLLLLSDLSSEDNKGVDDTVTPGSHLASLRMTFPVIENFHRYAIAFLLPLTSVVSRSLLSFFPFHSHTLPS